MSDIVRVLRILEYTGPRDRVEKTLAGNAVKGTVKHGELTIREATLGDFPEVIEDGRVDEIINLARRYIHLMRGRDWMYQAPELFNPLSRWIRFLAEGNIREAEQALRDLEVEMAKTSDTTN